MAVMGITAFKERGVIAVDGNGVIRLISIDLLSQEKVIQYR